MRRPVDPAPDARRRGRAGAQPAERRRRRSRSAASSPSPGSAARASPRWSTTCSTRSLARDLNGARSVPGRHRRVTGLEHLDKVVHVDQSPIGRTPRSNPATYTGVFDHVRKLFAATQEAKIRGYLPGPVLLQRQGRALRGVHRRRHDQDRDELPARRLRAVRGVPRRPVQPRDPRGALQGPHDRRGARHADRGGARVLRGRPADRPAPAAPWSTSGSATSGSASPRRPCPAARRSASSSPASCRSAPPGRTIYVLDEPTTGLHFEDVRKLLGVLHSLVDKGNSVLVIEHNLDVIKTADWVVDLGPEGGSGGGTVVATGTPEEVAAVPGSHTGRFLAAICSVNGNSAPLHRLRPDRRGGPADGREHVHGRPDALPVARPMHRGVPHDPARVLAGSAAAVAVDGPGACASPTRPASSATSGVVVAAAAVTAACGARRARGVRQPTRRGVRRRRAAGRRPATSPSAAASIVQTASGPVVVTQPTDTEFLRPSTAVCPHQGCPCRRGRRRTRSLRTATAAPSTAAPAARSEGPAPLRPRWPR